MYPSPPVDVVGEGGWGVGSLGGGGVTPHTIWEGGEARTRDTGPFIYIYITMVYYYITTIIYIYNHYYHCCSFSSSFSYSSSSSFSSMVYYICWYHSYHCSHTPWAKTFPTLVPGRKLQWLRCAPLAFGAHGKHSQHWARHSATSLGMAGDGWRWRLWVEMAGDPIEVTWHVFFFGRTHLDLLGFASPPRDIEHSPSPDFPNGGWTNGTTNHLQQTHVSH